MSSHADRQNVVWIDRRGAGRRRPFVRRVVTALLALPREFRAWYRGRQALHDLQQADPRILRDIGLEQADLWQAVRHGRIDRRPGPPHRPQLRPRPSDWC